MHNLGTLCFHLPSDLPAKIQPAITSFSASKFCAKPAFGNKPATFCRLIQFILSWLTRAFGLSLWSKKTKTRQDDLFNLAQFYKTYYNIASRATQSNSVTCACSKSRWCTLALMAWANHFARNFFSRERPLLAWGKIFRYFATIMDRNRDSTHQSQNEDNFRPFLLG